MLEHYASTYSHPHLYAKVRRFQFKFNIFCCLFLLTNTNLAYFQFLLESQKTEIVQGFIQKIPIQHVLQVLSFKTSANFSDIFYAVIILKN